jgi:hypothetical protein
MAASTARGRFGGTPARAQLKRLPHTPRVRISTIVSSGHSETSS